MRIIAALIIGLAAVVAGFFWANRPQLVLVTGALPADFPATGFSHDSFERLLQRYVGDDGYVDYAAWHRALAAREDLQNYLVAVSRFSPDATPERFPSREDELAYWMYGYNAYVINAVLNRWPLDSVMDVKAPVEVVQGLGFFYRMRYLFGEQAYSLYAIENDKIRKQFRDPRIHFVLNCASESCPVIRPELPTGDALELLLADAAREFVSDRRNVQIEHDDAVVWLSAIFKMYESDFVNHLRAGGRPAEDGPLAYVASVAPENLRADLDRARDYEVRFRDFDWSVNATPANASNATH